MTALVRLADLLARRVRDGARVEFRVTDDWQQGRTTYGGLVAVLAACALRDAVGPARPLRALQVNFVGSVPAGPAVVDTRVLREGRSVTQAQATLSSGGEAACFVQAVYGAPRASALPRWSMPMPATRAAEAVPQVPFLPKIMPAFLQHLATRWAEGDPPYTGGSARHSRLWLQLQGDPVEPELLAILFADAMPSPVMGQASSRVFAASLAWSIELLPAAFDGGGHGWWRADTELTGNAEGYANQVSTVWTPGGEPAAISHQVVAIYG